MHDCHAAPASRAETSRPHIQLNLLCQGNLQSQTATARQMLHSTSGADYLRGVCLRGSCCSVAFIWPILAQNQVTGGKRGPHLRLCSQACPQDDGLHPVLQRPVAVMVPTCFLRNLESALVPPPCIHPPADTFRPARAS